MKKSFVIPSILMSFAFCILYLTFSTGCGIYKFNEAVIADSIKTVRVNYIENKARYIYPQLSPALTDKLKQKLTNQTKLIQTNNDNAHLDIVATITEYSVITSAISNQQSQMNRLTVGVHVVKKNQLSNTEEEYDVNRSFEFPATSTLEAAQNGLLEEMVRSLTDDIFNHMFSNW